MQNGTMKIWKALAVCALVAPAVACTVQPAVPVAAVRFQPPVVVAPAPLLVAPAYKPHPGRGWARGHW